MPTRSINNPRRTPRNHPKVLRRQSNSEGDARTWTCVRLPGTELPWRLQIIFRRLQSAVRCQAQNVACLTFTLVQVWHATFIGQTAANGGGVKHPKDRICEGGWTHSGFAVKQRYGSGFRVSSFEASGPTIGAHLGRCRAIMAHMRYSRPDSGLGFHIKVIQSL